jgi:hypothetical protein
MILPTELKRIAKARLKDSQILFNNKRYDASTYLCGYSIELALKAKICRKLNWDGFPQANREFENCKCLKTHDMEVLLMFSGLQEKIKLHYNAEWSIISLWSSENRYKPVGTETRQTTEDMLSAVSTLLKVI